MLVDDGHAFFLVGDFGLFASSFWGAHGNKGWYGWEVSCWAGKRDKCGVVLIGLVCGVWNGFFTKGIVRKVGTYVEPRPLQIGEWMLLKAREFVAWKCNILSHQAHKQNITQCCCMDGGCR